MPHFRMSLRNSARPLVPITFDCMVHETPMLKPSKLSPSLSFTFDLSFSYVILNQCTTPVPFTFRLIIL